MKKIQMICKSGFLLAVTIFLSTSILKAQDKDDRIADDSKNAKEQFLKGDKLMATLFENSYGYAIFPNVGKGAVGVGAAAGSGVLYEKGKIVGSTKMKQLTVGAQAGGQAYREVIFFENKVAVDRFKEGKFEFEASMSAVAATAGASANAKYRDGVMVFTQEKAGLMYEAAVGGQKFDYKAY